MNSNSNDYSRYEGPLADKPDRERTSWMTGRTVREYDSLCGPTKHVEVNMFGEVVSVENRWL